jgi:acetyltransferase
MSIYRLEKLFFPNPSRWLAAVRERSLGRALLQKLEAGFAGNNHLVNTKHPRSMAFQPSSLRDMLAAPDVVVVAVPPSLVPTVVAEAGEGASAAIIITAGLGHGPGSLAERAKAAWRTAYGL